MTNLAALCAPPPRRGLGGMAWAMVIIGYIALCAGTGGMLLIAFPIFVLVLIVMGFAESKHRAFNRTEWPKLNDAWLSKSVCLRCHHQFPTTPSPVVSGDPKPSGANMPNSTDEKTPTAEASAQATKPPWHDRTGLVVFLIFLFWPVGLYGLFVSRKIPKGVKWAVGVFFGLMIFSVAAGNRKDHKQPAVATASDAPAVVHGNEVVTSHITKTLDEFRAMSTQDLQGDPDKSETSENGNKVYTWKREFIITALITDGDSPRVLQVSVVAARAKDGVGVKEKLVINAVGIMQARQMIQVASNGPMEYNRFDDVFIWLGENHNKKGATRTVGNVTVTVGNVIEHDKLTMTLFNIY
jgi:hypothetical protein